MPLTADRTYVPSERSGLPTIAIIEAINCRDVAIVTGNSAAPVLAKDRLPYQTLIASLLHKYASGRLREA